MSGIEAKYSIGDKVYKPDRVYDDKTISCPDCLGTKVWTVVFADGTSEEVMCQTCKSGFEPAKGYIIYKEWRPDVRLLTIGSIYGWGPEKGMCYMCEETGIGSGTIHDEIDLFLNKDDAAMRAKELYIETMQTIAKNNFSNKFKGKEKIGEMLSMFGFERRQKLEKARQFVKWAKISGVVK